MNTFALVICVALACSGCHSFNPQTESRKIALAGFQDRPWIAVWRNTDGDHYSPRLRCAVWDDGRVLFCANAPRWSTNLFAGRISVEEVQKLKARVRDTGILEVGAERAVGPSDTWCSLLLIFGDRQTLLHWSEQGWDYFWGETQPVHGSLPSGDWQRSWVQVNRLVLESLPQNANSWPQTFEGAPNTWYLKQP